MMTAITIPGAFIASRSVAADAQGMVKESDKLAMDLGYKEDANQVDTAKFAKRSGEEGKKQFCSNCQFFSAVGEDKSPCVVFGGKQVVAGGWCNSWFARA